MIDFEGKGIVHEESEKKYRRKKIIVPCWIYTKAHD
jgi:hypothetical protein